MKTLWSMGPLLVEVGTVIKAIKGTCREISLFVVVFLKLEVSLVWWKRGFVLSPNCIFFAYVT